MESIKNITEILHCVFNTESLKPMYILHSQHVSAQTGCISHAQLPLRPSGSHIWLHSCRPRALERQTFHHYLVPESKFSASQCLLFYYILLGVQLLPLSSRRFSLNYCLLGFSPASFLFFTMEQFSLSADLSFMLASVLGLQLTAAEDEKLY